MVETVQRQTNICQESEYVTSNFDTFLKTLSSKLIKIHHYITKKYKKHLKHASRNFLRIQGN